MSLHASIRADLSLSIDFDIRDPERVISTMVQLENAYWQYDDILRQKRGYPFMKFSDFAKIFLEGISATDLSKIIKEHNRYKKKMRIVGAVLLDPTMDHVLLVKNTGSGAWSFPKGKLEAKESDQRCAIREVWEEVNIDIGAMIRPGCTIKHRRATFFVVVGIERHLVFTPWRRGEIEAIRWHRVDELSDEPRFNIYIRNIHNKLRQWIKMERETTMMDNKQ